jgi:hypothetical protein
VAILLHLDNQKQGPLQVDARYLRLEMIPNTVDSIEFLAQIFLLPANVVSTIITHSVRMSRNILKIPTFVLPFCLNESSIMKLATSPCLKIFVLLSFSKPVISFDNRLETVRLSSQG